MYSLPLEVPWGSGHGVGIGAGWKKVVQRDFEVLIANCWLLSGSNVPRLRWAATPFISIRPKWVTQPLRA